MITVDKLHEIAVGITSPNGTALGPRMAYRYVTYAAREHCMSDTEFIVLMTLVSDIRAGDFRMAEQHESQSALDRYREELKG